MSWVRVPPGSPKNEVPKGLVFLVICGVARSHVGFDRTSERVKIGNLFLIFRATRNGRLLQSKSLVPPGSPKFELKGAISAFFRSRSSIRRTSNEENANLTPFIFEFRSLASPTRITNSKKEAPKGLFFVVQISFGPRAVFFLHVIDNSERLRFFH